MRANVRLMESRRMQYVFQTWVLLEDVGAELRVGDRAYKNLVLFCVRRKDIYADWVESVARQ